MHSCWSSHETNTLFRAECRHAEIFSTSALLSLQLHTSQQRNNSISQWSSSSAHAIINLSLSLSRNWLSSERLLLYIYLIWRCHCAALLCRSCSRSPPYTADERRCNCRLFAHSNHAIFWCLCWTSFVGVNMPLTCSQRWPA